MVRRWFGEPFPFIADAVVASGVAARPLDEAEGRALLAALDTRLGARMSNAGWPWDREEAPEGVQDPEAWRRLHEFVGATPCVLFNEDRNEAWALANGSDLLRLLHELPAIECYVCDAEATWLLCHNHHDVLVGWGGAEAWVRNYKPRANEQGA